MSNAKIEKEKIELLENGKVTQRAYLNRGYQRGIFYFEHDGIAAELARGKTKQQAKAEELKRAAITLFNGAIGYLKELSKLDAAAADALLAELYSGFAIANEARPGGGTDLKSLEQRAAAMHFAWEDAQSFVEDRAGIEYARLLMNACFDVQNEYEHGRIAGNARTREALRSFREMKDKDAQEDRRELSPQGRAIFEALEAASAALEQCAEDGGPDEDEKADRIMEEAEAALDALALEDPEEATRIFKRSAYFDEAIEEYEIYLGAGVFCRRDELKKLDTPEKRAAYVNTGKLPGEDETGADDMPGPISGSAPAAENQPLTICGGEAVKLDSGEPVTLEGFTDPVIIG